MRYWALVGLSAGMTICNAVLVWVFCRWRPGLSLRGAGVRSMLHFGLDITGFQIVNFFARNADKILLGRLHGSYVTGLYSRAYSLFMLPISQIRAPLTAVALPALSRIQNEPGEYARYYCKFASLLAFITMPLAAFLFVCSENTTRLVLGQRWMGASPIFRILALAAFIQAVETAAGLVLLSLGSSKRYLKWGIFRSASVVICFGLGIRWGGRGVAAAYTIGEYLILLPTLWYCLRGTPVSVFAFLRVISQPALASIAAAALTFLVYRFLLSGQPDAVTLGVCAFTGTLLYFAIWALLPGGPARLRKCMKSNLLSDN